MLTFQLLLASEGIEPKSVRLVRHQARGPSGLTPWSLWRAADGRFETYQRIQKKPVFGDGACIASFVATPDGLTLFVGLYEVAGMATAPSEMTCPLMLHAVAGFNLYDLRRIEALASYFGRLFVAWGEGYRTWVQRADRQTKEIVRLTPGIADPPFPGFQEFQARISEVEFLPNGWREVLSASRGVYLLMCPDTGVQYIGSAIGAGGFLGRWLDYARDGHGGNALLKGHDARGFTVSILETAASAATEAAILSCESLWKRKLGSRIHGLNAN